MTRISALIAALADAALTVAIGLAVPLLVSVSSWLITGGFQTTAFEVPFTIAAAIWALGLGGGVGFSISPEAYPALGLSEPFTFVVSIAPLAFTAFVAWMGWRAGRRLRDEDAPWAGVLGSAVAFAVTAWLSLAFATADPMRIDVQGAVTVGTLTWGVMLLIGLRAWEYLPWERWLGESAEAIADIAARAVRIAAGLVTGVFGLASACLLIALLTGMGRVIGLMETLHLDTAGVIGVGLLQLAYLPTLIVWTAAWLLGPGIQLGEGSLATLGGTDAGPLPTVPLLGLLPEGSSTYLWALVALPVALAAVLALLTRARGEANRGVDERVWWQRLLPAAVGALLAAIALAVFAQLSRGSIGPGRLAEFGPQPWSVLLAAFGLFALGGAIGTFLPLESLDAGRREAAARDERDHRDDRDARDDQDPRPVRDTPAARPSAAGRKEAAQPQRAAAAKPVAEGDREDSATSWPDSPYARPAKRTELRDAVQRPDEPDIYADLDLDEDQR